MPVYPSNKDRQIHLNATFVLAQLENIDEGHEFFADALPAMKESLRLIQRLSRLKESRGNPRRKRNPSLVVYGNPPIRGMLLHHLGNKNIVGRISNNVHQIKYEHVDDGEPYVHDFDPGVVMLAVMNGNKKSIFIQGDSGQPLWEDFD